MQWLYLTDNYIRKRIRDRYGILNPSKKLIFVKKVQLLFYRELAEPKSSRGYTRWLKNLSELVECEGGILNCNRKRKNLN